MGILSTMELVTNTEIKSKWRIMVQKYDHDCVEHGPNCVPETVKVYLDDDNNIITDPATITRIEDKIENSKSNT